MHFQLTNRECVYSMQKSATSFMYLFFEQWLKLYVSCTAGYSYELAIFCLMQSITINVVCNIIVWEALYLPFPAFYWNYLATEILQHQKFPELQYSYSLASSSLLQYWVHQWQLLAYTVQCYLWLFSWHCRNWYPAVSCAASAYQLKERILNRTRSLAAVACTTAMSCYNYGTGCCYYYLLTNSFSNCILWYKYYCVLQQRVFLCN